LRQLDGLAIIISGDPRQYRGPRLWLLLGVMAVLFVLIILGYASGVGYE
jgi:hypothetical protein